MSTCPLCGGRGVIRIGYLEEPDGCVDYGVCSCPKGQRFRSESYQAAMAAKFGVPRERVNLIEALLDPEDYPASMREAAPAVPLADVADAGRTHRKRRL